MVKSTADMQDPSWAKVWRGAPQSSGSTSHTSAPKQNIKRPDFFQTFFSIYRLQCLLLNPPIQPLLFLPLSPVFTLASPIQCRLYHISECHLVHPLCAPASALDCRPAFRSTGCALGIGFARDQAVFVRPDALSMMLPVRVLCLLLALGLGTRT